MNTVPFDAFTPHAWPTVAWTNRDALPGCAAVYCILDTDGTILYIGRTLTLGRRFAAHHRHAQCAAHQPTRIAWFVCEDVSILADMERALIAHFAPRWNGEPVLKPWDKMSRYERLRLTESQRLAALQQQ